MCSAISDKKAKYYAHKQINIDCFSFVEMTFIC